MKKSTKKLLSIGLSILLLVSTVLFVFAVLFGAYNLLSMIDGHAASREVGSYLRSEYNATVLSRL